MPVQNDDLFLVNRGGDSFKIEYGLLKTNLREDAHATVSSEAPEDPEDGRLWYNTNDNSLYVYEVGILTGVVTAVGIRNGGSGYTEDADNVTTTAAIGHGTGLTVDINAGVGGNFANPQVNLGGHAYDVGDIVYITGAGAGNGALTIQTVGSVSVGSWKIAVDSPTVKYTLNNDNDQLIGDNTTDAINNALQVNDDIENDSNLHVSDLVEIADTGNANANDEVIPGLYIWTGDAWVINNFWIRTTDSWGTVLQPSVSTDGLNVQGRIRFTGRNGNHIVSTDNPPPASTKAENDGVWLLTNTVYGIGNSNEGGVFGNSGTGTNWKTCITFKTGEGQACGEIQAKKQVEPRFAANSDRRLKSNIVDAESMLDKFEQLQVRRFTIASPNPDETPAYNVLGFIADELQQVFPDAVEGAAEATVTVGNVLDANGEVIEEGVEDPATSGYQLGEGHIFASLRTEIPKYQTVASSALIIPMAKAIQELIAINKDLVDRITVLEGGN